MIKIYNSGTSELIGEINEEQLDFLIEQLEEDTEEGENYYLDIDTIYYLEENGADEELIALLKKGLGEEEGIEILIEDEEAAAAG